VRAGCRSHTIGAMKERDLAVTLARGRIAFGVVSLLAPDLVARTMTGGDASEGGTGLFVRGALFSAWLARQLDPA
jgi:hypothetical protein